MKSFPRKLRKIEDDSAFTVTIKIPQHHTFMRGYMDCSITDISVSDYSDIALLNSELGYPVPQELVRQKIKRILEITADRVFITRVAGKAVGYIHLTPYELLFDKPMLNVMGLVVLEKYRRSGFAAKLMARAEEYAKEHGYTGIRLDSGIDRTGAHAFYESQGFIHRKVHKHFIKRFA